ncbi:hypothetical protein RvY_05392 [Ramazzottius varieornatus]|uniref:Uncharacterized protein n=1 Tax=Ramazzottius varieornatus TaxID=947166 RepID=A0A1D1UYI5_RAMVA|nr:hypothetical protein RvY_05392 [Ramazzottius varieornatus]
MWPRSCSWTAWKMSTSFWPRLSTNESSKHSCWPIREPWCPKRTSTSTRRRTPLWLSTNASSSAWTPTTKASRQCASRPSRIMAISRRLKNEENESSRKQSWLKRSPMRMTTFIREYVLYFDVVEIIR